MSVYIQFDRMKLTGINIDAQVDGSAPPDSLDQIEWPELIDPGTKRVDLDTLQVVDIE